MRRLIAILIYAGLGFTPAQNQIIPVNGWVGGDLLSSSKAGGTKGNSALKAQVVAAGNSVDLLPTVTGSGYIDDLQLICYQLGLVNVYVDGELTPSISIPAWAVAANPYYTLRPVTTTQWITSSGTGGTSGGLNGRLTVPIPFSTSIRVQYQNNTADTVTLWSMISYQTGVPNLWPHERHLHIATGTFGPIAPYAVITALNVSPGKAGRLVGFSWEYDGGSGSVSPITGPLEGIFGIYLNGSVTPQFTSSGTEDMFGMAGYFSGFVPVVCSTDACLLQNNNSGNYEAYRMFIRDPIYFASALKFTWQVGNASYATFTGSTYSTFVFWYYTD